AVGHAVAVRVVTRHRARVGRKRIDRPRADAAEGAARVVGARHAQLRAGTAATDIVAPRMRVAAPRAAGDARAARVGVVGCAVAVVVGRRIAAPRARADRADAGAPRAGRALASGDAGAGSGFTHADPVQLCVARLDGADGARAERIDDVVWRAIAGVVGARAAVARAGQHRAGALRVLRVHAGARALLADASLLGRVAAGRHAFDGLGAGVRDDVTVRGAAQHEAAVGGGGA